ncbi:MAG: DUF4886 domain-containing protein [Clostridia bacterium]|nr:DUF4886 domain-containing protein [Clostridia bacterium]
MKILALGNSFSADCTAHLEKMTSGTYVRNLYIGGCSLERHANNLNSRAAAYELQKDGIALSPDLVSANEIFASDAWDVITVQQVSGKSGLYDTYYPHLTTVLEQIRALCPNAKIVWNQTWAYATYSTHGDFPNYDCDQQKMFAMINETSHRVARENGLDVIEVGRAIQTLREQLPPDGTELCRDSSHLSLDYGRYAAAYVWAKFFVLPVGDYIPDGADPKRIAEIRQICNRLA